MAKEDVTTIQLSKETRDRLKELGRKGETYDEIVRRLLALLKNATLREGDVRNDL